MTQPPVAVALVLCERMAADPQTGRVSLVGVFHARWSPSFPSHPMDFTVYTAVTDGVGQGIMTLTITQLDTGRLVHRWRRWFAFPADRLLIVNVEIPLHGCSFPAPGRYSVDLTIDGQFIPGRALEVYPGSTP
jgi:hypothetical protein